METAGQVRQNARLARSFEAMDATEMDALLTRVECEAELGLEWYKRA